MTTENELDQIEELGYFWTLKEKWWVPVHVQVVTSYFVVPNVSDRIQKGIVFEKAVIILERLLNNFAMAVRKKFPRVELKIKSMQGPESAVYIREIGDLVGYIPGLPFEADLTKIISPFYLWKHDEPRPKKTNGSFDQDLRYT